MGGAGSPQAYRPVHEHLLFPAVELATEFSGGPFGAEGPIIMTGGAFGSMIAQLFHLTANERKTLLVAGAAGGMSANTATAGYHD